MRYLTYFCLVVFVSSSTFIACETLRQQASNPPEQDQIKKTVETIKDVSDTADNAFPPLAILTNALSLLGLGWSGYRSIINRGSAEVLSEALEAIKAEVDKQEGALTNDKIKQIIKDTARKHGYKGEIDKIYERVKKMLA